MSPTPRAALALAVIALLTLVLPVGLGLALAAVLLVLVAFDAWTVRSAPELHRAVAPVLSRGVPAELDLSVVSAPEAVRRLTLRQSTPAALTLRPAQEDGRLQGQLVAAVRGRHALPPAGVRAEGRLGLGARYAQGAGEAEVHVYPDLVAARRLALAARRLGNADATTRARGALGLGTEFESVRDWAPDDDVRHVNWAATQRVGRPMTNKYRLEQSRELVFLLDCGRLMAAPLGERTRLDAALDALTAVALAAEELGDHCGAVAFDTELRRELPPKRAGARTVITRLFDLQPRLVESDYELAFRRVGAGKRGLVIVLSDLFDDAAATSLQEAVPVLLRRHALIVASAADTELEAPLRTPPREPLDVFTAAAAVELLDARERAANGLLRAGATVVQSPPERFAAACVQAYVSAKRRLTA